MKKIEDIYEESKNRELTNEELRFLYEVDGKIENLDYEQDSKIKEILANRNMKEDLAKVFNCRPEQISNDVNDIFEGKEIFYFYGDLDLSNLKIAKGFTQPKMILGDNLETRTLSELSEINKQKALEKKAANLTKEDVDNFLNNPDNFRFSEKKANNLKKRVLDYLLSRNKSATQETTKFRNLETPLSKENLNLKKLTDSEPSQLDERAIEALKEDSEALSGLLERSKQKTSEITELRLPKTIGKNLNLVSSENPGDFKLPETIPETIFSQLDDITMAALIKGSFESDSLDKFILLPRHVKGNLDLGNLISAENLILPQTVGGYVNLGNLVDAENLTLSETVGESLYLNNLESTNGLTVPDNFSCKYLYSNYISMDDLKNASENKMATERQMGFSKIGILMLINIIIGIGLIIAGIMMQ